MKRKIIIIGFIVFALCFLSGCSKAKVTSELKFNSDGSGSRSVYATIEADDVDSIEGGLDQIDTILKNAAPEGVTLRHSIEDNGDAVYQFTFFFDNIKEYNEMIYKITGKQHNATWYTANSVFLSNIKFTEDECTTDLVTWAMDAIKANIGGWLPGNLNNYEVTKSDVYYNEELQYSGTGDPSFVINVAPKVTKASIYTEYSFDQTMTKKIEIQFEDGGLERVNLSDAKSVLAAYSEHYSFDRANDVITYELTDDQINEFLMSCDLTTTEEQNTFTVVKNPFQQKFEITSSYNLEQFFSMFDMSEALYIYDYVKLPTDMNDVEASHTDNLGNVEVPDGYQYAGAYQYSDTYTASFQGNAMIDLKSISVNYDVTKELSVKREVNVTYIKNGCEISKDELLEYYKDYEDTITVSDNGDTIKVTFILNRKSGTDHTSEEDPMSSVGTGSGIKYRYYDVTDDLSIARYLPNVEGYKWNSDSISYDYAVNVEKDAGIKTFTVGNLTLEGENDLVTAENGENYTISGTNKATDTFTFDVHCKQTYDLFYLILILLLFILIIAALVFTLIFLKKKHIIENTDYDDIEQL